MQDDLRKLLDGELDADEARRVLDGLAPDARREAEAMARIAAAAGRLERAAPSPDFAARAMARVRARRPPRRTLLGWLRAPRVSPLGAVTGAAAAAAIAAVLALRLAPGPVAPPAAASAPAAPVLAQLRLDAPDARSVQVAGDFNGWRPDATPLRRGEGGTWTVRVPVVPGRRYQYQFVVDGRWVTDPLAPAADDGFGGRNAVLDL
jgi:anti-sigma factor RsiW